MCTLLFMFSSYIYSFYCVAIFIPCIFGSMVMRTTYTCTNPISFISIPSAPFFVLNPRSNIFVSKSTSSRYPLRSESDETIKISIRSDPVYISTQDDLLSRQHRDEAFPERKTTPQLKTTPLLFHTAQGACLWTIQGLSCCPHCTAMFSTSPSYTQVDTIQIGQSSWSVRANVSSVTDHEKSNRQGNITCIHYWPDSVARDENIKQSNLVPCKLQWATVMKKETRSHEQQNSHQPHERMHDNWHCTVSWETHGGGY
jgi:hypothetical protein